MKANRPPISRSQVADSLPSIADRVAAAGIAPMPMEEINAEVKAARVQRKTIAPVATWADLTTEVARGRRKAFDDFLAKVPNGPASPTLKELLLSDVGRGDYLTAPGKRRRPPRSILL